jgi:hypothetical protein
MALSKEDHHDVKSALGKAMANKISKVTRDRKPRAHKVLGLSHKEWVAEGKPKAHY